jgi:hypothetical protein
MVAKLVGGGFAGALLILLYQVGMRIIAALDKLIGKLDDHDKRDADNHRETSETLHEMRGELKQAIDWGRPTPVEGVPIPRPGTKG